MSPLPRLDPDVEQLLATFADEAGAPAGVEQRVLERVHSTLGLPPPANPLGDAGAASAASNPQLVASTSTGAAGAGAGAAAGLLTVSKPVLIGVLVAGAAIVGGTTLLLLPASPPQAAQPASVEQVAPTAPPLPALVDEPTASEPQEPTPTPRPRTLRLKEIELTPQVRERPTHARPRGSALAAERALLGRARRALSQGQPQRALQRLEQHSRTFPSGQLAEEREALRVLTLTAAGHRSQALLAAASFEQRYPKSLFLPAIRDAMADSPRQQ